MIVYGDILLFSIITPAEVSKKIMVYLINTALVHLHKLCTSLSLASVMQEAFYTPALPVILLCGNYKFWEAVVDGRIAGCAIQSSLQPSLWQLQHKCVCPVTGASTANKTNLYQCIPVCLTLEQAAAEIVFI